MLAVTDTAAAVIRDLTNQADAPEGTGLRITTDPTAESLMLALSPQPVDGDVVLDADGARIFLEPGAATVLDDKALDAETDDTTGAVQFAVVTQPE